MPPFDAFQGQALRLLACALPGMLTTLFAAAQPAEAPVYRCGSTYSSTPCPGGSAVNAADARSAAQQKEAQAVKRREAQLADQLGDERRARERAAAGQVAAGIGPAAAPAPSPSASKPQGKSKSKAKKKTGTQKPKTSQGAKLGSAP
jgi:hypothetical protein